jgi:hypothetical protein
MIIMETFISLIICYFSQACDCIGLMVDSINLLFTGGTAGLVLASTIGIATGILSEGDLAIARRWHGGINDRYNNIKNLVHILTGHKDTWNVPSALLAEITNGCNILRELIPHCRGGMANRADRNRRNMVLKEAVKFCLLEVKVWAYAQYTAKALTADEVHALGFLLPGEGHGNHSRAEASNAIAEVKVRVINGDFIRVVIDRSAGENAGPVAGGWPHGIRHALIVINASDGKTEIHRQITTRLHNDIRMPEGSHGKQFVIKASFLRHVNDEPRFGSEPTFSMPLNTDDLANIERRHRENNEAQTREIERLRRENELLRAELTAQKR